MKRQPKFEYDKEADAAYLNIMSEDQRSVKTVGVRLPDNIKGDINLDFNADNQLIGIEFLYCSDLFDQKTIDQLPKIDESVKTGWENDV